MFSDDPPFPKASWPTLALKLAATPMANAFSKFASFSLCGLVFAIFAPISRGQNEIELLRTRWENQVRPILAKHCLHCHNEAKRSGQLNLESLRGILSGSISGEVVNMQSATESLLLKVLAPNAESHMPPEGQVPEQDIETLQQFMLGLSNSPDRNLWASSSAKGQSANGLNSDAATTTEMFPAGLAPQQVIDFVMAKTWAEKGIQPANRTTDIQFARRLYLDLLGRTPAPQELQAFQLSTESDKRETLVDRLLSSPEHAVHLSEILNALFIGRKDAGALRQAEKHGWLEYLKTAIEKDRPWNEVAAEILLARPTNEEQRGAVWYLYSRKNNHQEMAEAISRDFFGVKIDCAQCHDHPLADEILQRHYWGLTAFFNRTTNTETSKGPRLAESAIGGFSEFANIRGSSAPNELIFLGTDIVPETRPAKDTKEDDREDLYFPGVDGEPRIPKFSRREQFVEKVLKDHPLLAQAMVNRLWGHMLGRGLVHPVDAMDSFHPASHPSLLHWLSRDFERSGYRIRQLIRGIALSQTYQLGLANVPPQDPSLFASAIAKPLTAEAFYRSMNVTLELKNREHFQSLENRMQFSQLFPDVLAEESLANVSQGLMLSNSPLVDRMVSMEESLMIERLAANQDSAQITSDMFMAILQRETTEDEKQKCIEYLSNTSRPRVKLIEDLAWALITSPEFRFNH